MDLPAVRPFCLEQMDCSLGEYTQDFLDLPCLMLYFDKSLSIFYHSSLSKQVMARLPANGPREDFITYVEWVLVLNGLDFIVVPKRTPAPLPTQSSARHHVT